MTAYPPPFPLQPEDEDLICFVDEEEQEIDAQIDKEASVCGAETWKVIIVDDEPDVHRATELALKNFQFDGKSLTFFSAYSAEAGKQLITVAHPDAAVILLDVVMETHDAGLKVVQYIREELHNQRVRIILRTGQPGEAPEESVILNYDINDYRLKVELTRQRMLTSTIAALRSYRDIITIEQQRDELAKTLTHLRYVQKQLEDYTRTLEQRVLERTSDLEEANQELQRIATLDGLTQVANRRCFDEYLQQQWQLLQHKPLSLILIDVDYFKDYNDYYGHQAGDDCLRRIAQAIASTPIRSTDLVARYGGEEFVVVLPSVALDLACQIAARIMENVRALDIPHARSLIRDRVTISLGVASLRPEPKTLQYTIIEMADQALYLAKQQGRDRYCITTLPPSDLDLCEKRHNHRH